jgi:cyclase
MLKKRLIAIILVRDGQVVQSVKFKHTNVIHSDPIYAIESFNKWAIDEIIILNVSKDQTSKDKFIETIRRISKECFVPLTVGGWITDLNYAGTILANGADKIVVNTKAFLEPKFITMLAKKFGNQCVVVSIDSITNKTNQDVVVIDRGRKITTMDTVEWAKQSEKLGAGELLVNDINYDGNRKGYNILLMTKIANAVSVPVIAMGGVSKWEHLLSGIVQAGVDAVAAANIFHYTEHSTKKAKQFLLDNKLLFRSI